MVQLAQQLQVVFDSIAGYAVFTLDRVGHVTSWNNGAENIKGYSKNEIIGQNFACFYEERDRATELPQQALRIASETGTYMEQGWRVKKDGSKFWADVTIHPIKDEDDEITGFVKITRDSTANLELEKIKAKYSDTQRRDLIAQLTGGIAHDFNNLLTIASSGFELIKSYSQDQRIERIIDVNQVAFDRSKRLISQLLAFSERQMINPVPTDINQTIGIFDVLVNKAIGESIELQWDLAQDLPLTVIDEAQCQSALLNLVFNAREAMPHGGKMRIFSSVLNVPFDDVMLFDDLEDGSYVVLGVSDTGTGISPSLIRRIVEPFFTTKDVGQGAGLGLSQCYGFARQSGGTIAIKSEENVGTTVSMLFPVSKSAAPSKSRASSRTILLVDDEPAIRDLVGEMLSSLGHKVFVAEDAKDALYQLRHNFSIDYLFTDIIMPNGMNGVELVDKAREIRPGLPTLLASGYSREALRNLADLRDDIAFLKKPYSMRDLSQYLGEEQDIKIIQ